MKLRTVLLIVFSLLIVSETFAQQLNWEQTKGPYGGSFRDLKEDKSGNIYAATSGGLVKYIATEGKWRNEELVKFGGPSCEEIFIHTSERVFVAVSGGVICSDKNGNNWQWAYSSDWVRGIRTDNANGIYIITANKGVLKSIDSAKTWSTYIAPENSVKDILFYNDSLQFATSKEGLIVSKNGGKDWLYQNLNLQDYWKGQRFLTDSRKNIFIVSKNELFVSTDQGKNWQKNLIPNDGFYNVFINKKDQIFISGKNGVLFTSDFGLTWNDMNFQKDANCFFETTKGEQYIGTTLHLFKISLSNLTWELADNGICKTFLISVRENAGDLFVLTTGGFLYSSDYGNTWMLKSGNPYDIKEILFVDKKSRVFAKTTNEIVFSFDKGTTWTVLKTKYLNTAIKSIRIDDQNNVYLLTASELQTSNNFGNTWQTLWSTSNGNGNTMELDGGNSLYFNDWKYLYKYSFSDGKISLVDTFSKNIMMIAFSPKGHIYVNSDFEIYMKSPNNNWRFIYSTTISSANINFTNTGELYIWNMWVYKSKDYGLNIFSVPSPLITGFYCRDFDVSENGNLFFATEVEGLFRTYIKPEATEFIDPVEVPTKTEVSHNYPNPFNASTKIKISCKNDEYFDIAIYNCLGQKIETIVSSVIKTGVHDFDWQPKNLPSGVYFYRIQTPTFSETKKMIYLK